MASRFDGILDAGDWNNRLAAWARVVVEDKRRREAMGIGIGMDGWFAADAIEALALALLTPEERA